MITIRSNSYNVDVAKIFGVCSSVFLSYVNTEKARQDRAKTTNGNDTVAISRADIYDNTGLEDSKQVDVEVALGECGVLTVKPLKNVPNKNYYILNMEQLEKILTATKPEEVIQCESAKQFIKKPRVEPMSKRQTLIMNLKKRLSVEDEVIKQYMCDWIDSVYANPKGFLSPSAVSIAEQELSAYSNSQDTKIDVLKIAIKGGLRDLTWAMNQYEKNKSKNEDSNFVSYSDIASDGSDTVEEAF